jgi:hypothetical protein
MSEWQPIETAPKSTEILLWIVKLPWAGYIDPHGQVWSRSHGLCNVKQDGRLIKCSHWMPLPSPPGEGK